MKMTLAIKHSLSLLTFFLAVSWTSAHADLPDFRDLVKETSPAVVNISTVQHAQQKSALSGQYGMPDDMPEIFRHFFRTSVPSGACAAP